MSGVEFENLAERSDRFAQPPVRLTSGSSNTARQIQEGISEIARFIALATDEEFELLIARQAGARVVRDEVQSMLRDSLTGLNQWIQEAVASYIENQQNDQRRPVIKAESGRTEELVAP